jgi:hypothetical protein
VKTMWHNVTVTQRPPLFPNQNSEPKRMTWQGLAVDRQTLNVMSHWPRRPPPPPPPRATLSPTP